MIYYEPQSIIHQVIGLERKIERKIVRAFSNSRQQPRRRARSPPPAALKPDEDSTTSSDKSAKNNDLVDWQVSVYTQQPQMPEEEDEKKVLQPQMSEEEDEPDLLSLENDSEYQTMSQDKFENECLKGGRYFVHFYVRGSPVSKAIDTQMKGLSASFQSSCEYVRIDVTQFPPTDLFSLNVSGKQPTVVAMKNGKVINKISEFVSSDCEELKQWATTIELLSMSF
jgi:hypothetical protein